jgi:hypothetical protein
MTNHTFEEALLDFLSEKLESSNTRPVRVLREDIERWAEQRRVSRSETVQLFESLRGSHWFGRLARETGSDRFSWQVAEITEVR